MRRAGFGRLFRLVLIGAFFLAAASAAAGQYETLTPLLVDINGWEGEAPEGMDMDMGNMKMVQAMREYARGNQSLNAMIMVGHSAMAQGQMQSGSMESDKARIQVQKIDGFNVVQQYAKKEAEGAVVVSLSGADEKGAQFILHYTGLKPDEALALSKKFDWEKLQKATRKVK
jgi:hypothetical protein